MTLTELKKKYEADGLLISTVCSFINPVAIHDGTVEVEYTYDDWLNDFDNGLFDCFSRRVYPIEYRYFVDKINHDAWFGRESIIQIDCYVTITVVEYDKIRAKQRQYIDQQAERIFDKLKLYTDGQPKAFFESILKTSLWLLSSKGEKPQNFDTTLPFVNGDINDEVYEADFDTIREAYKHGITNINSSWVTPQALTQNINSGVSAMIAYVKLVAYLEPLVETVVLPVEVLSTETGVKILERLESLIVPAVPQPASAIKAVGGGNEWTPDPTKARMIMNRFDTILDNEIQKEQGKKLPRKNADIVKTAIELVCKDTSVDMTERNLIRYVKSLHNGQTAREYAGHYVGQKMSNN